MYLVFQNYYFFFFNWKRKSCVLCFDDCSYLIFNFVRGKKIKTLLFYYIFMLNKICVRFLFILSMKIFVSSSKLSILKISWYLWILINVLSFDFVYVVIFLNNVLHFCDDRWNSLATGSSQSSNCESQRSS